MLNILIEVIPEVIPDYQYVKSQSNLNFFFGENIKAILPDWKRELKKFSSGTYTVGFEINVYVFKPEGGHDLLLKESEDYQMISEPFFKRLKK